MTGRSMWQRLKDLWIHHRALLIAFVVVAGMAGFFGGRAINQFVYWSDPAKLDQPLAGWMTPRYVSRSYRVPPEVVQSAFAMDMTGPPRRISLDTLAKDHGVTMQDLQTQLDTAITAWRDANDQAGQ